VLLVPNIDEVVRQVNEALIAATPAPWIGQYHSDGSEIVTKAGEWICQLWNISENPMENHENNTLLIANAPEWLRLLLTEISLLNDEMRLKVAEQDKEIQRYKRHAEAEIDEELGTIKFPDGAELLIVPRQLDITVEEFFDGDMPDWLIQLIEENKQLKATVDSWYQETQSESLRADTAESKIAEQDKEIQKLRGLVKAFSDTGH
jgi:hypothetical protein